MKKSLALLVFAGAACCCYANDDCKTVEEVEEVKIVEGDNDDCGCRVVEEECQKAE